MAVIQMPSRGKKDETGMITNWYKKTGDWVAEGDELFSFDTDEGTYTVKSQKAGRLVAIFVPEGELVHCPADVGMLATPAPDAVLKMGRMQFVDETKPLSPRQPEPAAEEAPVQPKEEPAQPEEAPAPAMTEEQLLEEIPDETEEIQPLEEAPAQEEEPAQPEEEPAPAMTEEQLLEEIPDETGDIEPLEEAPTVEEAPAQEESPAQEEASTTEEASEQEEEPAQEEAYVAEEEPEQEEEPAAEEEPAQEEAPAAEEAPVAQEAPAAARPASLTAQVDMGLCLDIAARTGVTVAAMVRYAAMHTDSAALLSEVEDGTLRGMSGRELPNIVDLSAYGVLSATRTAEGGLCFLVPAVQTVWSVDNGAPVCHPAINLTLCFDEATVSMDCAARMLQQTCAHLTNLLDLLI